MGDTIHFHCIYSLSLSNWSFTCSKHLLHLSSFRYLNNLFDHLSSHFPFCYVHILTPFPDLGPCLLFFQKNRKASNFTHTEYRKHFKNHHHHHHPEWQMKNKLKLVLIIGLTSLTLLTILLFTIFCCRRRKRQTDPKDVESVLERDEEDGFVKTEVWSSSMVAKILV